MGVKNNHTHYGGVTKAFHWITALLILTAMPLGVIASNLPTTTEAEVARALWLFSFHKTVGITAFFVALLRILWAMSQIKPNALGTHGWQTTLAETVHWLLYMSMLLVPLSGWLHHAALDGYAPIWWPFGQDLPFIPKSTTVAEFFGAWHFVFTKVLAVSFLLHFAGALKHHVLDKDATLARMLPGKPHLPDLPSTRHTRAPLIAAVIIYAIAIGGGSALSVLSHTNSAQPKLAQVKSDWAVQSGRLGISFKHASGQITGQFQDWTAAITYNETSQTGNVLVTINIGSLDIGSLTSEALKPDYFNLPAFPAATFNAEIGPDENGLIARGTLTLRGVAVPVTLPFDLSIENGTATMSGRTQVDRRAFKIGAAQTTEDTIGFAVDIDVELTATQQ